MLNACRYSSPLGEIILSAEDGALSGLWFRGQQYECAGTDIEPEKLGFGSDSPVLRDACKWLDAYFSGEKPEIDIRLAAKGTPFRQRVWAELMKIGYGHTVSYGELAHMIGCRSARAVGAAVGKNPISIIIPCHRVLGADGSLTGYAGGIERKKSLLRLEGIIK